MFSMPETSLTNCYECGTEITEWDKANHEGLCDDCYLKKHQFEETLTLANAIKYSQGNTVKFDVNEFFSWVYDADENEQLIMNDFLKLPEEKQKDYIRNYALNALSADDWLHEIGGK